MLSSKQRKSNSTVIGYCYSEEKKNLRDILDSSLRMSTEVYTGFFQVALKILILMKILCIFKQIHFESNK